MKAKNKKAKQPPTPMTTALKMLDIAEISLGEAADLIALERGFSGANSLHVLWRLIEEVKDVKHWLDPIRPSLNK